MDSITAIENMWYIADKPERLRCFSKIVFKLGVNDAEVFWSNFWRIWSSSENLNEDEHHIAPLVEYGLALGSPLVGLEEDEREELAEMPEEITIYRGGILANQMGWSWTTDREKAHWFAKRAFGPRERIVSQYRVERSKALAYLTGRGESEIVLAPSDVNWALVDIVDAFETENAKSAGLFYAIQSGRNLFEGAAEMQAEMMSKTISQDRIENDLAQIEKILDFIRWANLRSKRTYFEKLSELLKARLQTKAVT